MSHDRVNQRRHERVLIGGGIEIGWSDEAGEQRRTAGKCIDVSEAGMKIEVRDKIPVGAMVNLRAQEARLHGSASVRYCKGQGLSYQVGLEFSGGLKREPPKPAGKRESQDS